jgi:lysophospholipase L1-like esterase
MRRRTVATAVSAVALVGSLGVAGSAAARPEAPVLRQERIERIVTLGDSYSSGTGIHRDAGDYDDHGPRAHSFDPSTRLGSGACSRELQETPGPRLAAELDVDSVFVACAGAKIREIPNQVAAARIPGTGAGTIVTMTIGGNDLRTERGETWPETILRCITSMGCDGSDANQVASFPTMRAGLTEIYTAIGEEFPDIHVRVLGYPRLMQSDRWCEGVTGFSRKEADWVDEQVDLLNAVISSAVASARAATDADIRFVSVLDEFDNHGACRFWQRDRYVNDAVFGETLSRSRLDDGEVRDHWDDGPLTISSSSFHPSSKGYDAYFRALRASVEGLPALTATH